ncbi:hypothetical protein DJ568_03755 [Mucilaginibacter hurinus]|uniref:WGR domain-containing protein n=1 Tax=Mucilaginibacter hurinus TaxID=2201324 RepID=A0A367GQY6_9SPHI|nr:hypothetical protein [Mucilaginibacter hurinus]RCH55877.1 hypothetical protein DJ568_03755 [Mucilaginibacter hurinus]
MLKLYKKENGITYYWETWDKDDKTGIIHCGEIGQTGESKEIRSGLFSSFRKVIQKEIDQKIKEGFIEIDIEEHFTLLIEYLVDDEGAADDVDKRHRLQDRVDSLLGWTGLGHCDGGSIGSGTMEVCCYVVDFDVAKQTIEKDLANTEFGNYTRVFDGMLTENKS